MQWRIDTSKPVAPKDLRAELERERGQFSDAECRRNIDVAIESACSLAEAMGKRPITGLPQLGFQVHVSIAGHTPGHTPGVRSRFSISVDEVELVAPAPTPPVVPLNPPLGSGQAATGAAIATTK